MIVMRSRAKRVAALAADAAIAVLAPFLRSGPVRPAGRPSVLLVRCDHIGDAVMATSVIAGLRAALDPSRLDVLAGPWATPVFAGHPGVDAVIEYATPWWLAAREQPRWVRLRGWLGLPGIVRRIRRARYDIGIDLRGDLRQIAFFLALGGIARRVGTDRTGGRALLTDCWPFDPALHDVEKNDRIVRPLGVNTSPALDWRAPVLDPGTERRLAGLGRPAYVVFALQGNQAKRSWSPDAAAAVVAGLRADGFGAVFIGGGKDRAFGDRVARAHPDGCINLAGELGIDQSLAVLSRAAATVAVDSGPMHMAAAAGCPLVALFGPGDPVQSGPWAGRVVLLGDQAPCGCRGAACDVVIDGTGGAGGGRGACMDRITPAQVLDALAAVMALREVRALPRASPAGGHGGHRSPSPAP